MKNEYPSYYKSGTEFIFEKLSPEDKKIIESFVRYCKITAGDKKVRVMKATILQFYDIIEKPYDKINLEDLRDYLSLLNGADLSHYTRNDIKKFIKKFLRWRFKDWSQRFNNFDDIKGVSSKKAFNHVKVNENTLITKEELEKLLRAAQTLKWKAILTFLYESACRPQELRNLRWKHIKYTDEGMDVTLFSNKTEESRTIPLKDCVVHIKRWEQEYQFPDRRAEDYVFPNAQREIMSDNALPKQLKILCRLAKIRFVHPYLFRHSRLTTLYQEIPEQIVKKYCGHSADSKMPAIYSHISNKDVKDVILEKIYNVKEISAERKNEMQEQIKALSDIVEIFILKEKKEISQSDFNKKIIEIAPTIKSIAK